MKTIVGVLTSLSWILSKSRVGVLSDIFLHLFIILTELSNFWMIHAICDAKQKSDLLLLCVFSGKKKKLKLRANSSRNIMIIVSLIPYWRRSFYHWQCFASQLICVNICRRLKLFSFDFFFVSFVLFKSCLLWWFCRTNSIGNFFPLLIFFQASMKSTKYLFEN